MGLLAKANAYLEQTEKHSTDALAPRTTSITMTRPIPTTTQATPTSVTPISRASFTTYGTRVKPTTVRTVPTATPTRAPQVAPTNFTTHPVRTTATPRTTSTTARPTTTITPRATVTTRTTPAVTVTMATRQVPSTTHSTVRPAPKAPHRKLRKLVAGLFIGVALQSAAPVNFGKSEVGPITRYVDLSKASPIQAQNQAEINQLIEEFAHQLKHSRVSNRDRNNLARMLYGEAGRGTDPFEVLHTVLNRMSSPLFKGNVYDILTAKGQYVGFDPANPVLPQLRNIVDFVVDEWEANGCQKIDGCNHYYFVTGIQNNCNKFEISEDPQGRWVPTKQKKYEKLHHYCAVANDQNTRFKQAYHCQDYVREF